MRMIKTIASCAAIAASISLIAGCASAAPGAEGPPSRTEKRPLVLVHYMPWYEAPPVSPGYGFHWHQGGVAFDPYETLPDGRANIAASHYPLTGPYDSLDPKILDYQTALMRLAGVDGVIFDWYGIDDVLDYGSIHRATLSMISALKRAGLKFAVCYEDRSIAGMIEAKKLAREDALEAGSRTFAWMRDHWFGDESYVRLGDRPLVLCFGPQFFKDRSQWDAIFSDIEPRPFLACLDDQGGKAADASYCWMPMWASESGVLSRDRLKRYLGDFYAKRQPDPFLVATAFPGFQDIYQRAGSGKSYGFLDYAKGETFRLSLDAAMAARPDILQIATWNDYGEGTIAEPTIERGYAELEVLQDLRRASDPGFPFGYSDLRVPIELYRIEAGEPGRSERAMAAYDAIHSGNAKGLGAALKAGGVSADFGVNPVLRDPSSPAGRGCAAGGSFDPGAGSNLALGMPIVYSSNIYAFTGPKAVDGDLSSYWEGAAGEYPSVLTVDIVHPRRLSSLAVKLNPKQVWGARTQRLSVLASMDGESFAVVASEEDYSFDPIANANSVAIPLGVEARYVRIIISSNSGATAGQVAELEIFGE